MGDIQIPGAPFVISIPDDWLVTLIGNEDTGPQAISAFSNEGTAAKYYINEWDSLTEIAQTHSIIANSVPGSVAMSMELNGMDCTICSGIKLFAYDEFWEIYYGEPLGPFSGAPRGHPDAVELSFTYISTENQGVILGTSIYMLPDSPDYASDTSILLLSGIWPASPAISKGQLPLPPIKGSHPLKLPEILKKAKSLENITHTKIEKPVTISRTKRFGIIPERTQKLLEYIKILQDLYKFLIKDAKYADYVKKLANIIKGLELLTK